MAKTLKTSAEGRKCIYPNCNQILSIYNHEEYCHVHKESKLAQKHKVLTPSKV